MRQISGHIGCHVDFFDQLPLPTQLTNLEVVHCAVSDFETTAANEMLSDAQMEDEPWGAAEWAGSWFHGVPTLKEIQFEKVTAFDSASIAAFRRDPAEMAAVTCTDVKIIPFRWEGQKIVPMEGLSWGPDLFPFNLFDFYYDEMVGANSYDDDGSDDDDGPGTGCTIS